MKTNKLYFLSFILFLSLVSLQCIAQNKTLPGPAKKLCGHYHHGGILTCERALPFSC